MNRYKDRKCPHCKEFFKPDVRNKKHQQFCSKPECRKASHKAAQVRWFSKPDNQDYFRGPSHVARVQAWRKNNPGYWKPKTHRALQDVLITEPTEIQVNSVELSTAALQDGSLLQDVLSVQAPVLIGLIAQFMGSTLQDDIAYATRRLQQLGTDILKGRTRTHAFSRTSETDTQAVELD